MPITCASRATGQRPARGRRAGRGGYARPVRLEPFVLSEDGFYRWFELAAANQVPGDWTLFDLRRLRHARLSGIGPDWRRVLGGFDLLIVIPQIGASAEMN